MTMRSMNQIPLMILLLFLSVAWSAPAQEQSKSITSVDQWQLFTPPNGGFNIRFPEKPAERTDSVEVAGKLVTNHEYSARRPGEYRVNYFQIPSDLKNSQAALLQGLANSIVIEHKGAVTSEREYSIPGAVGRMMEIKEGDGAIVYALVLIAQSRIYRVTARIPRQSAVVDPEAGSMANKFLESFAIVPIVLPAPDNKYLVTEEGEVDRFLKQESVASGKPADQGTVNGKATKLPTPRFPMGLPPNQRFSEVVEIKVVIDETGKVVAAQVLRGHPSFREVALQAARHATFEPTTVAGKPVKVLGTIVYNFVH